MLAHVSCPCFGESVVRVSCLVGANELLLLDARKEKLFTTLPSKWDSITGFLHPYGKVSQTMLE